MIIKGLNEYDIVNYKKPSMYIAFPKCSFKCDKECGRAVCQNRALAKEENIEISASNLIERYLTNPLTKAIVCGGLEPLDSMSEIQDLLLQLRFYTNDEVIIYTGYNENEIHEMDLGFFKFLGPVIIKFGRFMPDQEAHYDEVLGVDLASSNQYARRFECDEDSR